ncbi:exopolysaccharide biosynthesis protein [Magnetospirillum sp. UT-4]|uniref:exopolysaccharide biosynthesis protein n=1 Tax=Magnetospirillum sp. UT-4 TaxID=2681467 RepID=UPI00138108B8|nr:exopolysaccharide biosynthesis protein [Magnetospirillum sp. UT-4]CAA7621221.1 Exopolysaccharide synthesis, ExoD [Magnetospirillum sp. UT-4]
MRRRSLALELAGLRRLGGAGGATLAEAAEALSERSVLVMLLLLAALGMVPSPGLPLGMITGLLVVWLSLGRLWSATPPRLPAVLAGRRLPRPVLDAALGRLVPVLRRMERRAKVRLTPLATGPGAVLATLGIAVQGVVLAAPIPFGNLPPAAAILALAGGLAVRDGALVALGHGLSLASVMVVGALLQAALAAGRWLA